jgi:hypothetical protein
MNRAGLRLALFNALGRVRRDQFPVESEFHQPAKRFDPIIAFEDGQWAQKQADDMSARQIADRLIGSDVADLFEDPPAHAARAFREPGEALVFVVSRDHRAHRLGDRALGADRGPHRV